MNLQPIQSFFFSVQCVFQQKLVSMLVTGGGGGWGLSADSVCPLSLDFSGARALLTKFSPVCCYSCAWHRAIL